MTLKKKKKEKKKKPEQGNTQQNNHKYTQTNTHQELKQKLQKQPPRQFCFTNTFIVHQGHRTKTVHKTTCVDITSPVTLVTSLTCNTWLLRSASTHAIVNYYSNFVSDVCDLEYHVIIGREKQHPSSEENKYHVHYMYCPLSKRDHTSIFLIFINKEIVFFSFLHLFNDSFC